MPNGALAAHALLSAIVGGGRGPPHIETEAAMRSLATMIFACALVCAGCATEDIPQAFKGRMFGRTGPLAFYTGRTGFYGPVLGPGTYFTGTYDEIHKVDCSTLTVREPLNALTKDGVQFGLNIYVRFSADCSDAGVQTILGALPVEDGHNVSAMRIFQIYVQPAVGEAVREMVSPIRANDVNDRREELLAAIRKRFLEIIAHRERNITTVYEVNLSNLDFPDQMDQANTDRAVQAILRDKAIAERERVAAEIQTMAMRRDLAEKEGEAQAVRVERIGEALRKYPEFLQYDLQARMPEIYDRAGQQGNLVIAAPNPSVVVAPRNDGANAAARAKAVAVPAPRPAGQAAQQDQP
jgi:regulator of protease activity HflC (stomatin/prohibitin superfamily)